MPEKFNAGCQRPEIKKDKVEESKPEENKTTQKEELSMIKVGKPAPDFTIPAFHKGEFVNLSLSEFKGKWVLLCFYPGDFTFVWATEISAVTDKYEELQKLGIEVISISVDSPFVHKMWNEHELSKMIDKDIPFLMGSDQDGSVGRKYGIYDEDSGVETRGRFIIDPDGIVQGFEVLTSPVGRNINETIRQIKAFQLVRETKGAEVTPAGWKPGKKTLKPGPELVGRVWEKWSVDQVDN